jgi:hypothetical protein
MCVGETREEDNWKISEPCGRAKPGVSLASNRALPSSHQASHYGARDELAGVGVGGLPGGIGTACAGSDAVVDQSRTARDALWNSMIYTQTQKNVDGER